MRPSHGVHDLGRLVGELGGGRRRDLADIHELAHRRDGIGSLSSAQSP